MPFLIFLFIAGAIVFSVAAKKKAQTAAKEQQARVNSQVSEASGEGADNRPDPVKEAQARARQEELKRRLEENARRREAERAAAQTYAAQTVQKPAAQQNERRPLEKRAMESALKKERPIASHSVDDCGGGSIHDGFHEGVSQIRNKPPAFAGTLGHRLADEDERLEKEASAAENAKKVLNRISKLPPLAQGMIYSEILGKPKSEIA